jgi:enterobactin synthetase component D
VSDLDGQIDLHPDEQRAVANASAKRIRHFAAGRACARAGLRSLGRGDEPVMTGDNRQPVWPAGTEGSISHTDGLCVAVVALTEDLAGRRIGVDVEQRARVRPELYRKLFTTPEIEIIEGLPIGEQADAATVAFSAKEAFYKAQYPITEAWVSFTDVRIERTHGGARAHRVTDLQALDAVQWPVSVGVDIRDRHVVTTVTVVPAGA